MKRVVESSWACSEEDVNDDDIHTTQLFPCSTYYLAKRFRIFVHFADGTQTEIKLGENESTTKIIRISHNLEKLLLNNEFGVVEEFNDN